MTKDLLNKVRSAICILDQYAATYALNVDVAGCRRHREIQDVADGLLEVREEIQAHLGAQEALRKALDR